MVLLFTQHDWRSGINTAFFGILRASRGPGAVLRRAFYRKALMPKRFSWGSFELDGEGE